MVLDQTKSCKLVITTGETKGRRGEGPENLGRGMRKTMGIIGWYINT